MISILNCFGNCWRRFSGKSRQQQAQATQHIAQPATQIFQTHSPTPAPATNDDTTPILADGQLQTPDPNSHKIKITVRKPTLAPGQIETYSPSPHSLNPSPSGSIGSTRNWDSSSQRSRTNSNDSNTSRHRLREQFKNARLMSHVDRFKFIVPKSIQDTLITEAEVAQDILIKGQDISEEKAAKYAHKVCQCARQLYAILAYIKKGSDVCHLLDEGITDEELPLVPKVNEQSNFALYRKDGVLVETMASWRDKHLEDFDKVTWWMTAPTFECGGHYEFEDDIILPFIALKEEEKKIPKKQGAYSEVYPVRVHPAHHDFRGCLANTVDDEPLVAVKQLFAPDDVEFEKERTILKALAMKSSPSPHLIKLFATFKLKGYYHLMFPYADANLRSYWEAEGRSMAEFDKATVLWSLRQMTGIAGGLNMIHNFRVTQPSLALSVTGGGHPGEGNLRLPAEDVKLSVSKGEELYGRHGDIKPENLLWFKYDGKDVTDPLGVLRIADFGLGRFHGRDTRSGIPASSVVSSPTYEPPECRLRRPVARSYDIWSLGCLYLEFVTWLLEGSAAIDGFADARGRNATNTCINDDNFFTIMTTKDSGMAVVREKVISWSKDLHAHPKCSQVIHDLLDLIMRELLVVDSKGRIPASDLYQTLKKFLMRAEGDEHYLLHPIPRKVRHNSTGAAELVPRSPKRKSIQFSEGEKAGPPQPKPKDLVLRNLGTPSLTQNLDHHTTWPGS